MRVIYNKVPKEAYPKIIILALLTLLIFACGKKGELEPLPPADSNIKTKEAYFIPIKKEVKY